MLQKIEKILWILFIPVVIATLYKVLPVAFIAILGLVLGMFYTVFTLFLINGIRLGNALDSASYRSINGLRIVGSIFLGFFYSIVPITVLFKSLHWPGAQINLFTGIFWMLVATIIALIKRKRSGEAFYKRVLKRNLFFLTILLATLLVSIAF
ncbi:MAG: hypothetical protein EOP56_18800 [Sphingobacteriales bacterium]|nr:MAG: hypothetical protein EOP56_18800 [Sphingobacteriales bacterium]